MARLRKDGHDVTYVAEMDPGMSDEDVLGAARQSEAILLTSDKDFGELVYRMGRAHQGVVLLRLFGFSTDEKVSTVSVALQEHQDEIPNAFVVIEAGKIRIRHL